MTLWKLQKGNVHICTAIYTLYMHMIVYIWKHIHMHVIYMPTHPGKLGDSFEILDTENIRAHNE